MENSISKECFDTATMEERYKNSKNTFRGILVKLKYLQLKISSFKNLNHNYEFLDRR